MPVQLTTGPARELARGGGGTGSPCHPLDARRVQQQLSAVGCSAGRASVGSPCRRSRKLLTTVVTRRRRPDIQAAATVLTSPGYSIFIFLGGESNHAGHCAAVHVPWSTCYHHRHGHRHVTCPPRLHSTRVGMFPRPLGTYVWLAGLWLSVPPCLRL